MYTRTDSKLVEEIVNDIWKRLYGILSGYHFIKDLVGIERRIKKIESLLDLDTLDVRIIGIWGMGGIGKTTLARVVFDRLASQFEGYCFLENVKEKLRNQELIDLQRHLFSQLLNENSLCTVNQFVMNMLRCTKVLVVLDNVDDADQLELLAGDRNWFCYGSRIIITTRDKQMLSNIEPHEIYKVEELNHNESLQLFHSKAFRGKPPKRDFIELSKRIVTYAKGIPLALKVLGCHLCSKSAAEWESELNKLKRYPNKKVHDVMRISYEALDENEKNIFLDIAHFFKGIDQVCVERIIDASSRFVATGIRGLVDKSLISINNNTFSMHDLLQEMALEIIRQESEEPGKRSRLLLAEDIYQVLKYSTVRVVKLKLLYQVPTKNYLR